MTYVDSKNATVQRRESAVIKYNTMLGYELEAHFDALVLVPM